MEAHRIAAQSEEAFPNAVMSDMSESPVVVSACLTGESCRYDGQSKPHPFVQALAAQGHAVLVCPEVLGGLAVPRPPAGIKMLADDEINSQGSGEAMPMSGYEEMSDIGSDITLDMPPGSSAGQLVWSGRARLINRSGTDVTDAYKRGALCALAIARQAGAKCAILKQHSPSCGCGSTGGAEPWERIKGDGVTAALFKANGIAVISDEAL
ncbi:DUF523 domain-containing protein [bacterium]|nr:DUF523 domain-containing protein [bacterium]